MDHSNIPAWEDEELEKRLIGGMGHRLRLAYRFLSGELYKCWKGNWQTKIVSRAWLFRLAFEF